MPAAQDISLNYPAFVLERIGADDTFGDPVDVLGGLIHDLLCEHQAGRSVCFDRARLVEGDAEKLGLSSRYARISASRGTLC